MANMPFNSHFKISHQKFSVLNPRASIYFNVTGGETFTYLNLAVNFCNNFCNVIPNHIL